MINKLSIFVPGHITGFFEIIDNKDPSLKGSRGAGITLDEGVVTETKVKPGTGKLIITVNGKEDKLNTISKVTVLLISKEFNIDLSKYDIFINHDTNLPIGAGFGTSASFSLGISFTLPYLLGINITYRVAGDIAHRAEISQSSGLGDVISEVYGGCVLRLHEGSPCFGIIDKIQLNRPIYVITKTIGLLSTSNIIDDPIHKNKINTSGNKLLNRLLKNPNVSNFIKLSWQFAQQTELVDSELNEIITILNEETIGASMAMLGNTAFALSYTPDTSIDNCIITKINTTGIKYNKK